MNRSGEKFEDRIVPEIFLELDGLAAGFSLRTGGVSVGPFASFNLGLNSGDEAECVLENRRRLLGPEGFVLDDLAVAGQVHGADVCFVEKPGLFPKTDGLVTTRRRVVLAVTAADCAAVLFADPVGAVVAACHAGWRGVVAGVVTNTLSAMLRYGARTERIVAWVSPCISQANFEVGGEVAVAFDPQFVVRNPQTDKDHVDLKGAIVAQLTSAGVSPKSIEVSAACTYAEGERFFSYRVEGPRSGRMMGFIGMR
jgi:YfiH family protein